MKKHGIIEFLTEQLTHPEEIISKKSSTLINGNHETSIKNNHHCIDVNNERSIVMIAIIIMIT